MSHRIAHAHAAAAALAAALGAGAACAQAWPARAVRIVVPFDGGGGTDIQARLLARKFAESTGQSFVVDNRAGAAGMIGAELVAKSPADGYTVLFTTASLAVNATLSRRSAVDPLKELTPVS